LYCSNARKLKQYQAGQLRDQRDIASGVEQLQNGQYSPYDDESLPSSLQAIKQRGQRKLNQEQAP